MSRSPSSTNLTAIHAAVRRIPYGTVATYGQVAAMAGLPGRARLVGHALRRLPSTSDPEGEVPWHRVVNAAGGISPRSSTGAEELEQRKRLEAEGVTFDQRGRALLSRHGLTPASRRPR